MIKEQRPITHGQLVANLAKSGEAISKDLKENLEYKVVLLNEATATVQQAMQLDRAKKQAIYNKAQGVRAVGLNLSEPTPMVKCKPNASQADLLHMAIGIAGEAGELLHTVMSHLLNAEPIDYENLIEELGDLEFFMEGFRQNLAITRKETLSHNIAKLSKRYNSGSYSDNQAQVRADKL
jgi:NTP pyrophosphatase (non-canonical NTP hydrolase)